MADQLTIQWTYASSFIHTRKQVDVGIIDMKVISYMSCLALWLLSWRRELVYMLLVHLYVYLACITFCLFLFFLVSEVGCTLWLWHSLNFSTFHRLSLLLTRFTTYLHSLYTSFPVNTCEWQANTFEPPHDKTNKMTCASSEDSDQPESSLSAWRKLGSLATHWVQAMTLIRLGGCPGWSESSLGAQSFCWFCHEAAHFTQRSSVLLF